MQLNSRHCSKVDHLLAVLSQDVGVLPRRGAARHEPNAADVYAILQLLLDNLCITQSVRLPGYIYII